MSVSEYNFIHNGDSTIQSMLYVQHMFWGNGFGELIDYLNWFLNVCDLFGEYNG